MIFDALVVGYVRANLLRAAISIAAIALGVAAAAVLRVAASATITTFDERGTLFAPPADLRLAPYGASLDAGLLPAVRYLDGVASASPEIDRPIFIAVGPHGEGGVAARMLGTDLLQALPGVTNFAEERPGPFVARGAFLDPGAVIGTDGAILAPQLARALALRAGDRVRILAGTRVRTLRVASVVPPAANGVDPSDVFVDYTTAQRLFDLPDSLDRIDLRFDADTPAVRAAVVHAVRGRARLVAPDAAGLTFGALTAAVSVTFTGLALVALALGGLLVWSTVGTSIALRRAEIGTLRALGVAPHQIAAAFVCEGAAYGLCGTIAGAGLGAIVLIGLGGRVGLTFERGIGAPLLFAASLGFAVALVATLGPALGAARMPPAIAARGRGFEYGSKKLTFAGPWTRAFPGAAMVLAAQTFRAMPRRLTIAAAALALAVTATTAFEIASTSFMRALTASIERSTSGDFSVRAYGATFDARALLRVRATPGVEAVAGVRTTFAHTPAGDIEVRGDDDYPAPHYRATPAPEPPAALGSQLARRLGVARGGTLALRSPAGMVRVRVAEVRPDFADDVALLVSRDVITRRFGDDRVDELRVTLRRGADPGRVRNAVVRALEPARVFATSTAALRARTEAMFAAPMALAGSLGTIVIALAVAGVASSLAAFVFERREEFRTLRILGARRRLVRESLMLEAFAVAGIGCALGTLLGVAFAFFQLDVLDPIAIGASIPADMPLARIAAVTLLPIAGVVLATLGARRATE